MANNTQKQLLIFMNNIKEDIVSSINALGIRASGLSSSSAIVRKTASGGAQLEMEGYVTFLIDGIGRKPGAFPDVESIKDWIQSKAIPIPSDMNLDQLTFVIGRGIRDRGTAIFRGKQGIPLQKIIEKEFKDGGGEDIGNFGIVPDFIPEINKLILDANQQLQR